MTVVAADATGALVSYLKTTRVNDVTSGRVFRPELPDTEMQSMPRACVVIRRAGGYGLFGGSNPPVGDPTLDLFCYGETWLQSESVVAGEVILALRSLRTATFAGARLYWARIAGGPNPFDDPKTRWPCTVVSAQVAHCEIAVS